MKGWDGFLSQTEIKLSHNARKVKNNNDKDRLFTQSSVRFSEEGAVEESTMDDFQTY